MNQSAGEVLAAASSAPFSGLHSLTQNGPILVLAPHPDDESLGCGGLIAASRREAITVHVVVLTDGSKSHINSATCPPQRLSQLRLAEIGAALEILQVPRDHLHTLGWPDAAAPAQGPAFTSAVNQLVAIIRSSGSKVVFACWGDDPHCDHKAASTIAAAACRITGIRHMAYPVWGRLLPPGHPVQAGPPYRLDVAVHLPAKRAAVACHKTQLGTEILDAEQAFCVPPELLDACLTDSEIFFDQTRT